MTQRIFDIENEKDMQDLWSILPIDIIRINKRETKNTFWGELFYENIPSSFISINWHDKTEITRPLQEATEADIGKLCYFWDGNDENYHKQIGLLTKIRTDTSIFKYILAESVCFAHCRRLTKQEIEEIC